MSTMIFKNIWQPVSRPLRVSGSTHKDGQVPPHFWGIPVLSQNPDPSSASYFKSASVSLAIASSSFVGITNTLTFEPGFCELSLCSSQPVIFLFVKINSEIAEIAAHLLPYVIIILSPIPAVNTISSTPIHCSHIGTDVFLQLYMRIHPLRSLLFLSPAFIASVRSRKSLDRPPERPNTPDFFVEDIHHSRNVKSLFLGDELHDRRIDISGAGSHHKSLQRSQSHGSINGFSVHDSCHAGSVPEMAHTIVLRSSYGLSITSAAFFRYIVCGLCRGSRSVLFYICHSTHTEGRTYKPSPASSGGKLCQILRPSVCPA